MNMDTISEENEYISFIDRETDIRIKSGRRKEYRLIQFRRFGSSVQSEEIKGLKKNKKNNGSPRKCSVLFLGVIFAHFP